MAGERGWGYKLSNATYSSFAPSKKVRAIKLMDI